MSQTTQKSDPNNDADNGDSMADVLADELAYLNELLASLSTDDLEDMSDRELVDVRTELKELEDEVEDARKERADEVLADRVDVGERLHGLKRVQSHSKYVAEDDGSVVARAVAQGIDYTEFVSVNASTVAEEYPDLAEIGKSEYTYFV